MKPCSHAASLVVWRSHTVTYPTMRPRRSISVPPNPSRSRRDPQMRKSSTGSAPWTAPPGPAARRSWPRSRRIGDDRGWICRPPRRGSSHDLERRHPGRFPSRINTVQGPRRGPRRPHRGRPFGDPQSDRQGPPLPASTFGGGPQARTPDPADSSRRRHPRAMRHDLLPLGHLAADPVAHHPRPVALLAGRQRSGLGRRPHRMPAETPRRSRNLRRTDRRTRPRPRPPDSRRS